MAEAEPPRASEAAPPPKGGAVEPALKEGVVESAPPYNPAAWMHERIVRQIMEFERHLDPEHEIGGRFVGGPSNDSLHIDNVGNWGPDMIIFMGRFPDGRKFELMQHYSQVNVLLTAVRKMNREPRRIGFELMRTVKEQPHPWGDPII